MSRRERSRTRIVATLGPASSSPTRLRQLVRAGVDVFRLNFSHGTHDEHRRMVQDVRRVSAELGVGVAILQDLPGPKLRVGALLGDALRLRRGAEVVLFEGRRQREADELPVDAPGVLAEIEPGATVRLADGHIELRAVARQENRVRCRVVHGGLLRSRQGLCLPGGGRSLRTFTAADRRHLELGLELGVDAVALSFVQDAQDVRRLWRFLDARGAHPFVVAKIERAAALDNLDEILDVCSGVMVARGDLGVEIGAENVPLAQKRITREALRRHRPVITATEMLESMVEQPHPTRAEVSDVANAVLEGTDALMLSAETAVGRHPARAVETLVRVARELERSPTQDRLTDQRLDPSRGPESPVEAVSRAARVAARALHADALVAFTDSGRTVRFVSSQRPLRRLLGVTPREDTWRRLRLFWGVEPVLVPRAESVPEMLADTERRLLEGRLLRRGATIVIVCGESVVSGGTNTMKIHRVGQARRPEAPAGTGAPPPGTGAAPAQTGRK